jgi:hypothetical protein
MLAPRLTQIGEFLKSKILQIELLRIALPRRIEFSLNKARVMRPSARSQYLQKPKQRARIPRIPLQVFPKGLFRLGDFPVEKQRRAQ